MTELKKLKQADKEISSLEKFLVPLTFALLVIGFWYYGSENYIIISSLFILTSILFLDLYMLVPDRLLKIWSVIKWIIVSIIISIALYI